MIVGAPRDNATKLSRIGLSHTGSIYRCRVAKDSACEEIEVDTGNACGYHSTSSV